MVNGWGAGLGWCMQVAAHGTGASLPTVEEQIVRLKIVTPTVCVDDTHNSFHPRGESASGRA